MPRIFEIFGHPLADQTPATQQARQSAQCPFMDRDCDGGGNRELSRIDLTKHPQLQAIFPARTNVAAGVCSIQLRDNEPPWIVCPRRLLVMGREAVGTRRHQAWTENYTLQQLGYPSGTRLGIWPEVKLKYTETVAGRRMSFDYTFDYIVMPITSTRINDLSHLAGEAPAVIRGLLQTAGYAIARRAGDTFVEDGPSGVPSIIEIMTSSTSGSNKNNRSTIPMAFEDAMLGRPHAAPGINYRQVWARMVSQLIVKSEVALHWGGKTVWIVQDKLVDYIDASTGLNMRQFLAQQLSEVNMISFSFGTTYRQSYGVIDLQNAQLFAGMIAPTTPNQQHQPTFSDMIRSPALPNLQRLLALLVRKAPANHVIVP